MMMTVEGGHSEFPHKQYFLGSLDYNPRLHTQMYIYVFKSICIKKCPAHPELYNLKHKLKILTYINPAAVGHLL